MHRSRIRSRIHLILLLVVLPLAGPVLAAAAGDGLYPLSWCQAAVIQDDAVQRQTPEPLPLVSVGQLNEADWRQLQDPVHGPLRALAAQREGAQWGPSPSLGISVLDLGRLQAALLPIPAGPRRHAFAILTGECWAGTWRPTALEVRDHHLQITIRVMPACGPCPAAPPRLVYLLELERIDPQLAGISLQGESFEPMPQPQQLQGHRRRERQVASAQLALDPGAQQPVASITADELHRSALPQPPGAWPPLMPRVLCVAMRDAPGAQEGLLGVRRLDLRSIDPAAVVSAPPESLDDGPGYREACAVVVSPPLHDGEWMSLAQEDLYLQQVHLQCVCWRDDTVRSATPTHREVLLIPLPDGIPAHSVQLTTTALTRFESLYREAQP
jgi:hypothetical protein